ncbi:MAG: tetratricopeptide repeat protein [Erythrobacter sp.]
MSWLPILALGLIAMAIAIVALRLPKQGWTLFAAFLMFGLAGYATQGNPGQSSAPKAPDPQAALSGEEMVAARLGLFDPAEPRPAYLTVSDGFARNGRFAEAAQLLRKGLSDNPTHGEGWLALANALVEHAEGQVTPAAVYAFATAEDAMPGHPGPAYFLGFSLLRSGKPVEARQVWQDLYDSTPEDAPWREDLGIRIAGIDQLIAAVEAQTRQTAP